ncbi:hypothetical protein DPMN_134958 [Dreissena polymorpha]|uniref:Uncharacterized protein n=1 Tax=Dreissena polymorpha TaxID=45954 RepID=A0A9D4FWM0_DREPO|nr:hypothetical protein DPMN_134958 [Dreissena polymorpha]
MDKRNRGQSKANCHIIKRANMTCKGKPPDTPLGNIAGFKPVLFKALSNFSLLNYVLRVIHKRGDKNYLALLTAKTVFMQTFNTCRPIQLKMPSSNTNNSALKNDTDFDNDHQSPANDFKKYGTIEHTKIIRRENALRRKRLTEIINKTSVQAIELVDKLDTRASEHPNDIEISAAYSLSSVILTPYERRLSEQRDHPKHLQSAPSQHTFNVFQKENVQFHTEQRSSKRRCLSSISTHAHGDTYSLSNDESEFGDAKTDIKAADKIQHTERPIKQKTDMDVRKISYRRLASCLFMPFCRRYRLEIFVEDEENECLTPPFRANESNCQADESLLKMRTRRGGIDLTCESKRPKKGLRTDEEKIQFGNEARSNENLIGVKETQMRSDCFDVNTPPHMNTREEVESHTFSTQMRNTLSDNEKDNIDVDDHAGRTKDSNTQQTEESDISDSEIEPHDGAILFDVDPKKYGSLQHMKQIRKQNKMMQVRLQSVSHRKNIYVNPRGTSPERGLRNRLIFAKMRKCVADKSAILHHGDSTSCSVTQHGVPPKTDVTNADLTAAHDSGEQIMPVNRITNIGKTNARIKSSKPTNAEALCQSHMNDSNKKHPSYSPKTLLRQRIKSAKQYGSVAHYQKVKEVNASIKSRVQNAATKLQTWQPVEKMESLTSNMSSQLADGTTAGKQNLKSWKLTSQTFSLNGMKRHYQQDHSSGQSEFDDNKVTAFNVYDRNT